VKISHYVRHGTEQRRSTRDIRGRQSSAARTRHLACVPRQSAHGRWRRHADTTPTSLIAHGVSGTVVADLARRPRRPAGALVLPEGRAGQARARLGSARREQLRSDAHCRQRAARLHDRDIGQSAFINYGCSISATRLVRIGARCNIGTGVIIMDSDFHRIEPERRTESPEPRPIVLEENVWLGARVIVLGGVTIGAGSVIGAGSIVTRDIPPRSVAVGQPAKVVRTL
jgi:acetyltransferase-like isoleucine patch superfamily enzyme